MSLMQQKDIKKYDLTCIEICVSGSAPFPTEALRRWVSMTHASITEGFGLTEASPCVTANPLDGPQKEGSIGVAFPHTEIRIVDINDSNHVLGPNEEGEMLVRGPQVMQGYWNRPEETAATLTDGWLHTGDLALMDAEGNVTIKGRSKNMLLGPSGQNIYPEEIEDKLNNLPYVSESIIVQQNEKLVGLVYPDFDDAFAHGLNNDDIERVMEENRVALNAELPAYSQISKMKIYPEEFEKTPKKSIKRYLYQEAKG